VQKLALDSVQKLAKDKVQKLALDWGLMWVLD
jgi:hypothetical protein